MDVEIRKPFQVCFCILKFYGLWIDGEESRIYRNYGITLIVICPFLFSTLLTSGVYQNGLTLESVETISYMMSGLVVLSRVVSFISNIKIIKQLYNSMDKIMRNYVKNDQFIRKRLKTFFRIYMALEINAVISVVAGDFVSVQSKTLPYKIGVPFDTESSEVGFWIVYSYLFVTSKYMAPIYPALGMLPVFFMNFVIGFMEDFNDRLQNFGKNVNSETKRNEIMARELREIIETYEEIRSFIEKITNIFRYTFFIKSIAGSLILCTSLFVIPLQSDISQIVKLGFYTFAMCCEIFLHCYYGNEITLISRKFSTSLFHSEWLTTNKKVKKSMILLKENLTKDLRIEVFGIYNLSLSSFMKIVNAAYSYLMLLRQLQSRGFVS